MNAQQLIETRVFEAEQEDAQKREQTGLRSWRKDSETSRVSIRLTATQLKLWQSVAWTDDQSLTELVHRAVGAEIKKRERKRGEKYPPELPEGQKMPTGPRGGYRDWGRRYDAAHPDSVGEVSDRRRAKEENVEHDGTWPKIPLDDACKYCGDTENLARDHIVPVSRGGAYTIENYQTLCRSCNCAKGDKLESEIDEKFFERRRIARARRLRK